MKWYEELENRVRIEDENSPLYELPIRVIIENREDRYPLLEMCRECILNCKKHNAENLSFRCFDFRRKEK